MALVEIPSPGIPLEYGAQGDPLVILVHDWYGRLPGLEADGSALAHDGFHVLIPDLYDGWAATDEIYAASLLRTLDLTVAVNAIGSLARSGRAAGAPRVGLVGYALGGWLALAQAQAGSVDATVAYYATLDEAKHGVLPCPVQLHFAEVDGWYEGGDPDSFVARLADDGTSVEAYEYVGTAHSFANLSIPDRLETDAATLAFTRTESFLAKHLAD